MPPMTPPRPGLSLFLAASVLLVACTSSTDWSLEADDEVYELVSSGREQLGLPGSFSIAVPEDRLRQQILAGELSEELLELSLADCQGFAAENSRDYQARRENLYLTALDLTLERYRFGFQIDGSGAATLTGSNSEAEGLTVDGGLGFSQVLGNGANVVLDLGANLFASLASGDPTDLISDLSLSITQPLLGGASEEAIFESLTRAERRVVDEARRYERFRRSFCVDVFSRYWRILEQHEVVANEESNVASLSLLRERNDELAAAGRMDDIQAGQATQNELRARSRLIAAHSQLEGLYDNFKFFMGLPINTPIGLDRSAFEAMAGEGIEVVSIGEERATQVAMAGRLDLATTRDQLSDATRRLRIAKEDLGSRIDFFAGAGVANDVDPGFDVQSAPIDWNAGLTFDSPIDRLAERNAFRAAEIARDAAMSNLEEAEDSLRVAVRGDLRSLGQAAEDFAIQANSVTLAERRVESTELKLEAGRAQTRDLLEARDSLIAAQNGRVSALVDYKLARLALLFDMEELVLDEDGVRARDPELLAPDAPSEEKL